MSNPKLVEPSCEQWSATASDTYSTQPVARPSVDDGLMVGVVVCDVTMSTLMPPAGAVSLLEAFRSIKIGFWI